jgi:hypothetical protein
MAAWARDPSGFLTILTGLMFLMAKGRDKESSAYLHHGGLSQRPIRILDNPDGAQVVEHPTLTLEEGRLLLHQLYLQVLLVAVLLHGKKAVNFIIILAVFWHIF